MQIAIVSDGSVVQIGDYRDLFPNTSFPSTGPEADFLSANSCLTVTVWKPYDHATEKLSPATPYVEDGQVFTVVVEQLSAEELQSRLDSQWANVRYLRNFKLSESDWTQVADAPVDQAVWATYRQELRDITQQSDPFNIIWPTKP